MITELQQLVVRLTGDGSSYMGMLKGAEEQTEKTGDKIATLGSSLAGFLGALGVKEFLGEAKEEWLLAETAVFKLNSALKANGANVKELGKDYQEFATQLQKVTTTSDETILGLVKTAESYDLTGAAAKRAVKDAMALSAATDVGQASAMRIAVQLEKGDTERAQQFSRSVMQLRGVKDEAEFVAKYQKLIAAGQITMQDELKTGAGRAANFANQWSDALEGIGQAYTEVANPIKIVKRTTMDLWNSMDEGTQRTSVHVIGWVAQITAGVTAVTALNALLPGLKGNLLAIAKNPLAWAAVATIAIGQLTKELMGSTKAAKDFAAQMDAVEQASKSLRESTANAATERIKTAEGDRGKLEKLKADMEKGLRAAEAAEKSREADKPYNRVARGADFLSRNVGGPENQSLAAYRAAVDQAKKETQAWRDQVERVNNELEKLGKQANKAGIERAIAEAKKAADAAGKDADQLAREKAVDQGANAAQLKELDLLTSKKKLREQILALEKEALTAGLNDKEKALAAAADAGADKKQLDRIRGAQREKELGEMLIKTKEDAKLPEDKYADELSKLTELYDRGQLSAYEFAVANQKLRDSILGVAAAEQAAMAFGSSQDMAARRQYFSALQLSPANSPPGMPQANKDNNQGLISGLAALVAKLNEAEPFKLAFVGGEM